MNINTLTIEAQEALQAAMTLASTAGNQAVEPLHILAALVSEEDSLAGFLLSKVGANPAAVRIEAERAVKALPKVLTRCTAPGTGWFWISQIRVPGKRA